MHPVCRINATGDRSGGWVDLTPALLAGTPRAARLAVAAFPLSVTDILRDHPGARVAAPGPADVTEGDGPAAVLRGFAARLGGGFDQWLGLARHEWTLAAELAALTSEVEAVGRARPVDGATWDGTLGCDQQGRIGRISDLVGLAVWDAAAGIGTGEGNRPYLWGTRPKRARSDVAGGAGAGEGGATGPGERERDPTRVVLLDESLTHGDAVRWIAARRATCVQALAAVPMLWRRPAPGYDDVRRALDGIGIEIDRDWRDGSVNWLCREGRRGLAHGPFVTLELALEDIAEAACGRRVLGQDKEHGR